MAGWFRRGIAHKDTEEEILARIRDGQGLLNTLTGPDSSRDSAFIQWRLQEMYAALYERTSSPQYAVECLELLRALLGKAEFATPALQALIRQSMGQIYFHRFVQEGAEEFAVEAGDWLKSSLARLDKNEHQESWAGVMQNLGALYSQHAMRRFDPEIVSRAEKCFQEVLALPPPSMTASDHADVWWNLGLVFSRAYNETQDDAWASKARAAFLACLDSGGKVALRQWILPRRLIAWPMEYQAGPGKKFPAKAAFTWPKCSSGDILPPSRMNALQGRKTT
jgi:hypothetical protein